MSFRNIIFAALALIALLLIGGAFLWPSFQRRGFVVRDHGRAARDAEANEEPARDNTPATNRAKDSKCASVVVNNSKTPEDTRPSLDTSKLGEGNVLIRAEVRLKNPHGLDLMRICDREYWTLQGRCTYAPDDFADFYWEIGPSGLVEVVESRELLPFDERSLKTGTWSARIAWGENETFSAIAAPKYEDRVLDFGVITLDVADALVDQEWLIVGRLVHTTGLPIPEFESVILVFGDPEVSSYWPGLHNDGSFGFSSYEFNKDAPRWLLVSNNEDEDKLPLPEPKIEGRIVDFGDIKLDCAAVEVHFTGWPDKNLRMARHGLDKPEDLGPLTLFVSLSGYSSSADLQIEEPAMTGIRFLHPGPYRWYASQSDASLAFAPLTGIIETQAGKITQLEIRLEPVPCVLLRCKAARPLDQLQFEVQWTGPEDEVQTDYFTTSASALPYALPNPKHLPMRVTATARGYQPVSKDVAADAGECLIEFGEPVGPAGGKLVVLLPKLPEEIKNRGFNATISVTQMVDGRESTVIADAVDQNSDRWGVEENEKQRTWEVGAGQVSVCLRERAPFMGYPEGLMCGPIEATIEPDKVTIVRLPVFAAPPWAVYANQTQARLTCDNQPISYAGPVSVNGATRSLQLYYNYNVYLPKADYAVIDGDARLPLEFDPPTTESMTAVYHHNFPARLEIRVKRGKANLKLSTNVTVTAVTANGDCRCETRGSDSDSVRVWLPRGNASVQVDMPSAGTLTREIEVKSDLTVIEFELDGSFVKLDWDERYRGVSDISGALWLMRDAKGSVFSTVGSDTEQLKLEPGRYSMVPEGAAKPEVEFELVAGADVTVHIPFVAALEHGGSVLVHYPKELKQNPDGYHMDWRWVIPVTGDLTRDLQARDYYQDESYPRYTAEGVKFVGLPLNIDFIFVLTIAAMTDDGDLSTNAWALPPMHLTLRSTTLETLETPWKRATVMGYSWDEHSNGTWRVLAGQGFRYPLDWRVLLPGTYELQLFDGESPKSMEVTVVYTEGKLFEMPEAIQKAIDGVDDPGGDGPGGD